MESYTFYQMAAQKKGANEQPTYDEFSKVYDENHGSGWIGRKVKALPYLIVSIPVKVVYHIAKAFFSIVSTMFKSVLSSELVRNSFSTIGEDFKEGWGYFVTLFSDRWGYFQVERSNHQKTIYRGETLHVPPVPPPAAPPPPPFVKVKAPPVLKKKGHVRSNSQPEINSPIKKEWKPASLDEIQAAKSRLKKPDISKKTPLSEEDEIQQALRFKIESIKPFLQNSPDFRSPPKDEGASSEGRADKKGKSRAQRRLDFDE